MNERKSKPRTVASGRRRRGVRKAVPPSKDARLARTLTEFASWMATELHEERIPLIESHLRLAVIRLRNIAQRTGYQELTDKIAALVNHGVPAPDRDDIALTAVANLLSIIRQLSEGINEALGKDDALLPTLHPPTPVEIETALKRLGVTTALDMRANLTQQLAQADQKYKDLEEVLGAICDRLAALVGRTIPRTAKDAGMALEAIRLALVERMQVMPGLDSIRDLRARNAELESQLREARDRAEHPLRWWVARLGTACRCGGRGAGRRVHMTIDLALVPTPDLLRELQRRPQIADLSLVGTEELITELLGRFDHAILAGLQVVAGQPNTPEGTHMRRLGWRGNAMTCAGLASAIGLCVCQHYDQTGLPSDPYGEFGQTGNEASAP